MKRVTFALLGFLVFFTLPALAQQSKTIGHYTVHYNALNTNQLPPQVAQAYGLERSASRALLNITVLYDDGTEAATALPAKVEASARNLTGQVKNIVVREIRDPEGAIYYIGEFRVNNMETFDFTVFVTPENSTEKLQVKFRQQFYTE